MAKIESTRLGVPLDVIILRGIPGSGKTTLIRNRWPDAKVVSADHYFTGADGVYRFDGAKLPNAHAACLRAFVDAVQVEIIGTIIVDNTGTTVSEVAPYAALALAYGHNMEIVTLECDPFVAASRNIHGVSPEHCYRMAKRLRDEGNLLPPYWRHTRRATSD